MPKLVILGSSNAVPDENHENTHMALVGEERQVLIDCVSNPIVRLKQAGLKHEELTDLVLSHMHPDHVSGVPLLLMGMGLLKRENVLTVYGLESVLEAMQKMLQSYDWDTWHSFPVKFQRIAADELAPLLATDEFRIYTSPVKHFVPTVGFRIEFPKSGKVLAYSCDTAPNPNLLGLAKDADVFIHEAAIPYGSSEGHSTASQAGEMAQKAGAKKLYLIHYPTNAFGFDYHKLVDEAAEHFEGPVALAEDFMTLDF